VTIFLRLLADKNKSESLSASCAALRLNTEDHRVFQVMPESFCEVPGTPFAYWVSEAVRGIFNEFHAFESEERTVRQGLATANDFRFIRAWWETMLIASDAQNKHWFPFAKGGSYSPFYSDLFLEVNWRDNGREMKAWADPLYGNSGWSRIIKSTEYYFRPGITWPRRTSGLSFRALPAGCLFADKGSAIFIRDDNREGLLTLSTILNSCAFGLLLSLQLARTELAQSFEVGLIQQTPVPDLDNPKRGQLADHALRAWSLKRLLDTVNETSHAFLLPGALRRRLGEYDENSVLVKLSNIQHEIDATTFDLYGFTEADRAVALGATGEVTEKTDNEEDVAKAEDEVEADGSAAAIDQTNSLLSWAAGVAFGRFDLRLATGEREPPPEPDPFDPLPPKSPGMLPDGDAPFHAHPGILVDDPGHPHDLARLIEDVLAQVDYPAPEEVRRWLQRDFFPFHLRRYSKSRRKAPIYWPLATASGSYTLWIYYPNLTSQTLYTAINDFVGPKLKDLATQIATLRGKGDACTREEAKTLENLRELEQELIELRDALLRITPGYKPDRDDGVQITAAPLWPLFRHKPWQKLLRDTWDKLARGDYDWAHLAMAYWSDRAREKCRTDKSLAIAHDLEDLYEPPPEAQKPPRTSRRHSQSQ